MRHMRKAIVVLTVLAACSSGSGWSDSERADFIAGCEGSGQTTELCTCAQKKIEAAHPDGDEVADLTKDEMVDVAKECAG